MSNIKTLKKRVIEEVDARREQLVRIADTIHANPEIALLYPATPRRIFMFAPPPRLMRPRCWKRSTRVPRARHWPPAPAWSSDSRDLVTMPEFPTPNRWPWPETK